MLIDLFCTYYRYVLEHVKLASIPCKWEVGKAVWTLLFMQHAINIFICHQIWNIKFFAIKFFNVCQLTPLSSASEWICSVHVCTVQLYACGDWTYQRYCSKLVSAHCWSLQSVFGNFSISVLCKYSLGSHQSIHPIIYMWVYIKCSAQQLSLKIYFDLI